MNEMLVCQNICLWDFCLHLYTEENISAYQSADSSHMAYFLKGEIIWLPAYAHTPNKNGSIYYHNIVSANCC